MVSTSYQARWDTMQLYEHLRMSTNVWVRWRGISPILPSSGYGPAVSYLLSWSYQFGESACRRTQVRHTQVRHTQVRWSIRLQTEFIGGFNNSCFLQASQLARGKGPSYRGTKGTKGTKGTRNGCLWFFPPTSTGRPTTKVSTPNCFAYSYIEIAPFLGDINSSEYRWYNLPWPLLTNSIAGILWEAVMYSWRDNTSTLISPLYGSYHTLWLV